MASESYDDAEAAHTRPPRRRRLPGGAASTRDPTGTPLAADSPRRHNREQWKAAQEAGLRFEEASIASERHSTGVLLLAAPSYLLVGTVAVLVALFTCRRSRRRSAKNAVKVVRVGAAPAATPTEQRPGFDE